METDNKPIVYQNPVGMKMKKSIREMVRLMADSPEEGMSDNYLKIIPVTKERASQMQNPFVQEYFERRNIYLVDYWAGQKKGQNLWLPLTKIAIDWNLASEALEMESEEE